MNWRIFFALKHFNPRSREGSDRDFPAPGVPLYKISIHAPAKGATDKKLLHPELQAFQSTLPRRERQNSMCAESQPTNFNPRSREGSDALWQSRILHFYQISIHAPAKGATNNMEEKDNGKNYFNPRSREGSDQAYQSDFADLIISIHAPAKGATDCIGIDSLLNAISIHAPAKGATFSCRVLVARSPYFNPRSREGSDFAAIPTPNLDAIISIHAPAKGATNPLFLIERSMCYFNPRSREGSDY